jgi:hypothetical protein
MSTTVTPTWASQGDPLELLASSLTQLAAADATRMPASEQARCLQALERADAIVTAVRARVLGRSAPGRAVSGTGITVRGPG